MTHDNASFPARTATDAEFFDDMRWLIKQLRPLASKHDIVDMLIRACILHGMDGGRRITAAISHLGFNAQHAGMRLQHGLADGRWWRDDSGYYHAAETETASIEVPRAAPTPVQEASPTRRILPSSIRVPADAR